MLSTKERGLIYDHAYVPEHLPDYVEAISGAEGFLHQAHLCYVKGSHLIFVGYPLPDGGADTARAYESACKRFDPATVAVVAPAMWLPVEPESGQFEDNYYWLDLPLSPMGPDRGYMVRRASRELDISQGTFGNEHERLVQEFIAGREVMPGHKEIFREIPAYLKRSKTARLLEARRRGELIAFNVLDLGSAEFAFWLFNFRSFASHVPGASDLLLWEMARMAQAEGKKRINLGLGINAGVRRFKEKWGAVPFLAHASALIRRKPMDIFSMLSRF